METQVAIVGAGPAGLVLARLLELRGIDSVLLELRSREYAEGRVRAGVLEQRTVDLLTEAGVVGRLHRQRMVNEGIELRFAGRGHRSELSGLAGGRKITVLGAPASLSITDAIRDAGVHQADTPACVKQRARVPRCHHARLARGASVSRDAVLASANRAKQHSPRRTAHCRLPAIAQAPLDVAAECRVAWKPAVDAACASRRQRGCLR